MFEKIKKWYKQGLWSEQMVRNAFDKNVLTEEQMNEILGIIEEEVVEPEIPEVEIKDVE